MMKEIAKYEGATLFRSDKIQTFNLAPGVRTAPLLGKHREGANDQVGVYRNVIEPGCSIKREVHPEIQETLIVISGTAKVRLVYPDRIVGEAMEETSIQLLQGDVLTIEAGTVHEVKNDARLVPFVYFCIASPPF